MMDASEAVQVTEFEQGVLFTHQEHKAGRRGAR